MRAIPKTLSPALPFLLLALSVGAAEAEVTREEAKKCADGVIACSAKCGKGVGRFLALNATRLKLGGEPAPCQAGPDPSAGFPPRPSVSGSYSLDWMGVCLNVPTFC